MEINYSLENLLPNTEVNSLEFDVFIYAIGYEKRSSFFRSQSPRSNSIYAIDYSCAGRGDYDENLSKSKQFNDHIIPYSGRRILEDLKAKLKLSEDQKNRRIGVDISCLDRTLMSYVILTLIDVSKRNDEIVFLYTPSKFSKPTLYLPPLKKFAAAIPELAGSVGNPYKSRALIMGLGYEYGAALNVFDILEPEFAHLFYPVGDDKRFLPFVKRANFEFEFGMNDCVVSNYNFTDPVSLHGQMRDIIYSLQPKYTVMIVPFGPKIFSALGILLCLNNKSDCSFMRYSLQDTNSCSTIESSGVTHGFTMKLS